MSQEVSTETAAPATTIYRPSAAIDPARLDYLWTLSERMALSSAVPETLSTYKDGTQKKNLPTESIAANLFLVFEQAERWNMSPFALMGSAAIVYGKLGFEGKVISAVLKSCYGIDLEYEWSGPEGSDERSIIVKGTKIGGNKELTITGTVAHWKTTGNNSPWKPLDYDKMLAYRGAREWARLHEPSAILGVMADDELLAIEMERRAQSAREVSSLGDRLGGAGFNPGGVAKQIEDNRQMPIDTKVKEPTEKVSVADARKAEQKEATTEANSGQQQDYDADLRRSDRVFVEYSGALSGVNTQASIEKMHEKFWEDNDGKPTHPKDVALARQIMSSHLRRAKGEIEAAAIAEQLESVISASFDVKI